MIPTTQSPPTLALPAVASPRHGQRCDAIAEASDAKLPTMVFRLALSLRRFGATAEADALFSKSSRMLAERQFANRIRSAG